MHTPLPPLLLPISSAFAAKCLTPPLHLPHRNISVIPGILHTGIPLAIGDPPQRIAAVPSLQIDDAFVPRWSGACVSAGHAGLGNGSFIALGGRGRGGGPGPGGFGFTTAEEGEGDAWTHCAALYGGAYAPELSGSYVQGQTKGDEMRYFSDTWRFDDYLAAYTASANALPPNSTSNLTGAFLLPEPGKPFGMYGAALLGLTPDSRMLAALAEKHAVPSSSWSLSRGGLCLGCVDAGAAEGEWHTFQPADRSVGFACVVKAKVEALNWHPAAGVEGATLIRDTFTVCVDPGVRFLVLPPNAMEAFEGIVGREVRGVYNDYLAFEGVPGEDTGVLSFRIEGGLEVNVSVAGAGDAGEGEWKVPIGKGTWGAYGNETWVLGKPFTDEVVLRWDGAEKEYGIANRSPDPTREMDIQPLGCDSFPEIERSVTTTPGTGMLVGSAVGGFAVGLAFALAGFWFFRRGEKGVRSKYAQLDEDTVPMRAMSSRKDSWMTGTLSPPPPSIHESLRSQTRSGAQMRTGLEVPDSQLYEAPEGGTAYPTKRERPEM